MKERILQLTSELNQHNYNYYNLDNPTISDYEFDTLLKELEALEAKYPEFNLPPMFLLPPPVYYNGKEIIFSITFLD